MQKAYTLETIEVEKSGAKVTSNILAPLVKYKQESVSFYVD